MERKYEESLQRWIDGSHKALLIYGARQVGKTYLVRKMLDRNSITYFEVNFQEREDILNVLKKLNRAEDIITRLSLYSDVELDPEKSVIFLDEIQLYPEIITKIKFLVDGGKYRFILSGSNLGVELKGIKSMPIGYVEMMRMYPMNLFEFSKALGVQEEVLSHVRDCFENRQKVDALVHQNMITAFYYYLISGGMPSVVDTFVRKGNLGTVRREQENILQQYKADFVKYENDDRKLRIISIFDSIPAQLNQQNRRFVFTQLDKELKFNRYENSFLWLKDAGVAIPVYIADQPKPPLILSKSTNLFKLFMGDVGLLTSCYPDYVSRQLLEMNPEQKINNGALFENFIAQELLSAEIAPYYFKSRKIGEIDFVIEGDDCIVPLEIKSGSDYKKHRALDNLLASTEYSLNRGIVFSTANVETEGAYDYLPIYMTGLLGNKQQEDVIIDIDIFK